MDLNLDKDRNRRTGRMHLNQLPQALQGQQIYIADRIDGLITTSTGSPFTSIILPYVHWERPDNKIAWRVFSFDEGLASRVPYESAARTLTESREQFSTYATRHGLAITMEHNFMMSEEGRTNFYHRVQQVVGSIQKTNDLHVHMALIKCGSYFRKVREKYYRDPHSMEDEIREYVNMFGMVQKNVNAMDILIEDAKQLLRGWGASEPNFLLLNSRLTFSLQMNPERTQYLTQGPDGQKRLEEGPDVKAYRGIRIIHSRAFPIEEGSAPRDLLRRRVRVGEFYVIPNCTSTPASGAEDDQGLGINSGLSRAVGGAGAEARGDVKLYDESSDSFVVISYQKLLEQCRRFAARANAMARNRSRDDPLQHVVIPDEVGAVLLLRPNIEHWMLGIIMGKGGSIDDLGATLWGQTELSCFDDGAACCNLFAHANASCNLFSHASARYRMLPHANACFLRHARRVGNVVQVPRIRRRLQRAQPHPHVGHFLRRLRWRQRRIHPRLGLRRRHCPLHPRRQQPLHALRRAQHRRASDPHQGPHAAVASAHRQPRQQDAVQQRPRARHGGSLCRGHDGLFKSHGRKDWVRAH
jgi:hypothetical protein